jgi:hypothetical protein
MTLPGPLRTCGGIVVDAARVRLLVTLEFLNSRSRLTARSYLHYSYYQQKVI